MASIRKRKGKWQVQIRRKGSGAVSRTFHVVRDAQAWAKAVIFLFCSHSKARVRRRVWDLTQSRSVSIAATRAEIAFSKSSQFLQNIHCFARTELGSVLRSKSSTTIGMMRLLHSRACAVSAAQVFDLTNRGLRISNTAEADSIARKISCSHSADGWISARSIQVSLPRAWRALSSRSATALSAREYEMKRSGIVRLIAHWRYGLDLSSGLDCLSRANSLIRSRPRILPKYSSSGFSNSEADEPDSSVRPQRIQLINP
jgi:hypothetical protein